MTVISSTIDSLDPEWPNIQLFNFETTNHRILAMLASDTPKAASLNWAFAQTISDKCRDMGWDRPNLASDVSIGIHTHNDKFGRRRTLSIGTKEALSYLFSKTERAIIFHWERNIESTT